MFDKILTTIRDWIDKMISTNSISSAVGAKVDVSDDMATALTLWSDMYENAASWLNSYVQSLNLPASIAAEISRSATIEMEVEVSGSTRADALNDVMLSVVPRLREQIEYAEAKGGMAFKPYIRGGRLAVDYIQADQFYPVRFDESGNLVAAVFSDKRKVGDYYYTRLEFHNFNKNQHVISSKAYRSASDDVLGSEVALGSVSDWADIQPVSIIKNVDAPLFSYFKVPLANNIDTTSNMGVSAYSRATNLIKQADILWSDLLWEFESGKRAIYAEQDAFKADDSGNPYLPNRRLYRNVRAGGNIGEGKLFQEWSPEFREASYKAGLDAILKKIEYACGLSYGTLSDPNQVATTATEIKASRQRTYATITDTQKALKDALDGLVYALDVYMTLYDIAPAGKYEIRYEFDDSIVTDHDTQFAQDLQVAMSGGMDWVTFLVRNYGYTESEAQAIADKATKPAVDFFQQV